MVFSYELPRAGLVAAKSAVQLVESLAKAEHFDLETCIAELSAIAALDGLGPSTRAIVESAKTRDIPWRRLDEGSFIQFGYGAHLRRIRATVADSTGNIAVEVVQDKFLAKKILQEHCLPVPPGLVVEESAQLGATINALGYPLVMKPVDGNHGRGVTTNICDMKSAELAFKKARRHADEVLVERFIRGEDYRLLLVNYKLVAAARRIPAHIVGDGVATVQQLIDRENSNPNRGEGHEKILTKIDVDEHTLHILEENSLGLTTILPRGTKLLLKDSANLSTGGTSEDVTDMVPPETKFMAERAARILGLDICGIDLIASDITRPLAEQDGAILEINAAPGFRMHTAPSSGRARKVGEQVIEMLFPDPSKARIPIVAVTGTNGKTSTVRLISHMAQLQGSKVGCTTTEGIYIDGHCIATGDCSGPRSARMVLSDPLVDFAILECARGGILREGLGFDRCDVSVITNIAEDHLGLDGVNDLSMLARVKGTVAEATKNTGFAVLNAEDEMVLRIAGALQCKVAYFALQPDNPVLQKHFQAGGAVAYIKDGWLVLGWQEKIESIMKVGCIPVTMGGKYECMLQNCLAASIAAKASGMSSIVIRKGLRTFLPNVEMNLGRMNTFFLGTARIIVDYAHNAHGFMELGKYLNKLASSQKLGVITATGDRREKDIIAMGKICAGIFDRLVIRHDTDTRGRSREEITSLLLQGIREVKPLASVSVISSEDAAVKYAMDSLASGGILVVCSDDSRRTLDLVSREVELRTLNKNYGT